MVAQTHIDRHTANKHTVSTIKLRRRGKHQPAPKPTDLELSQVTDSCRSYVHVVYSLHAYQFMGITSKKKKAKYHLPATTLQPWFEATEN